MLDIIGEYKILSAEKETDMKNNLIKLLDPMKEKVLETME